MELKRALELHTEYYGVSGTIRVDKDDYVCLNEMASFFPNQRIDNWLRLDQTKQFITVVENEYKIPHNRGIITKRGKGGGTWAHQMIAFEFATWLSPEFKLKVYREYMEGTQNKKDWNIKRIMASNNYKMLCDAVKNDHEKPKPYHFSNEARMINGILFGESTFDRELANEDQLNRISEFEQHNATLIMIGKSYQERKEILTKLFIDKATNIVGVKNDAS